MKPKFVKKPKFQVDDRVLYRRPRNIFFGIIDVPVYADMGLKERVMHLNAKDRLGQTKPITGRILAVHPHKNGLDYSFQPDGWEGTVTRGFVAPEDQFSKLNNPDEVLKGTITNRNGQPV